MTLLECLAEASFADVGVGGPEAADSITMSSAGE
jgi:hypothetical protein